MGPPDTCHESEWQISIALSRNRVIRRERERERERENQTNSLCLGIGSGITTTTCSEVSGCAACRPVSVAHKRPKFVEG